MASLLDELRQQLDPSMVEGISQKIGANEEQTDKAISALVPMMIGGMSQNVQQSPNGAESLNRALEEDHDGSLLGQLSGLFGGTAGGNASSNLGGTLGGGAGGDLMTMLGTLGGGTNRRAVNADGILDHLFGGRRSAVQDGVSQATGLNGGQVTQLMGLLAPLLMSTLGKVKRQQNLGPREVADLVNHERQNIEEQTPGTQQGSLLGLLDSNRDGKIDMKDDIAKVGMALGGAFLLSRRGRR